MRAFATTFSAPFCSLAARLPFATLFAACKISSADRCECHTSIVRICAKSRIDVRYAFTDLMVTAPASLLEKPLLRAAIVKLAAMRLTSYSKGPGRVSSKSLRSNNRTRSGDAKTPKFDRCASPHSWTWMPAVGVCSRSAAMILAAPR